MRKTINVKNLLNTDGALTQGGGKDCPARAVDKHQNAFPFSKKNHQGWKSYTTTRYFYILAPIQ